ncbi:MAG TPA: hypothetical protein VFP63_08065 [Dehalococcoidia bacterium]|nr:hypothetical protein [Dehalococcoidia bacterium]
MTSKTMVVLLQENSDTRGEINWFDYAQDAERFIESLLDAGFERQSIRVMEGQDMDVLITQKPMVTLLAADKVFQAEPPVIEIREIVPAAVVEELPELSVETVEVNTFDFAMEPDPERELVSVAAAPSEDAEPYTKNGIRFSSAFASEY